MVEWHTINVIIIVATPWGGGLRGPGRDGRVALSAGSPFAGPFIQGGRGGLDCRPRLGAAGALLDGKPTRPELY